MLARSPVKGPSLVDGTFLDSIIDQVNNPRSVGGGLTAVGTNQATSLALTSLLNVITSAALGTGVTLPSAASVGIGNSVIIFNDGASAIQVYGAGSDTIDTIAAATGVVLTNAKRCQYYVTAAATWESAQLGVVSA